MSYINESRAERHACAIKILQSDKHWLPDATVENHGSLALVRPHSRAARDWIRDNVEDTAHYFGAALAVEPRYVAGLVEGMIAAGLVIA